MKKNKLIALLSLVVIGTTAWKIADDIISRLGMEQQSANYMIVSNIIGRFDSGPMEAGIPDGPSASVYNQLQSFRIPYAKLLPSVIAGDKTAAATELCEYIKTYVSSEAFLTDYNKLKEAAMPLTDNGTSLSTLKRNSEVIRKNIKNYPNDTKYVAEQQKELDLNEKKIAALIEAAKKPFPLKEVWEKAYPADPKILVKKRLQEYLTLAATVDFTAKLTGTGKKQLFVNPAYEKKSLKWKAIFRMGKEVNEVVTAFIKEWLKTI